MPIYEFECPLDKRRFEVILGIDMADKKKFICTCDSPILHMAERIWSLPGNVQLGEATKIFVNNQTGDVFTPVSRFDKPPKGYHAKELKGPIERTKFEKEQQHRVDGRNQFISHHLDSLKSEARKNRQDDTKARLNSVQREVLPNPQTGKDEVVEYSLDHKEKALLKNAMERSNRKKRKEKKSDVLLAINHQDSSNVGDF
jgi:hypothetical protein